MTNTEGSHPRSALNVLAAAHGLDVDPGMSGELSKIHDNGNALVMAIERVPGAQSRYEVILQVYALTDPEGLAELDLRTHESYEVFTDEDVVLVARRLTDLVDVVLPIAHHLPVPMV